MIDPAAPPPTSGSDADPQPDGLTCEVCGQAFTARIALFNHLKKHERQAAAGETPGVEPKIGVQRAAKPTQKELAQIQDELASNVETVGQLVHGALIGLKLMRLQDPERRLPLPGGSSFALPAFDTHLGYTLISRSQLTAKVLVEHAGENETLLKWIVRFNGWFKGGEVGQLVGAHVVAAAASVGVENPILGAAAGALIGDVVERVQVENHQLRQQVAQLQAQAAAAAGVGRADERGAGS
jgi:hypothetical protein